MSFISGNCRYNKMEKKKIHMEWIKIKSMYFCIFFISIVSNTHIPFFHCFIAFHIHCIITCSTFTIHKWILTATGAWLLLQKLNITNHSQMSCFLKHSHRHRVNKLFSPSGITIKTSKQFKKHHYHIRHVIPKIQAWKVHGQHFLKTYVLLIENSHGDCHA